MSHTARWKIFAQDFCRASPQICENWNVMMSSYPKVVWLFIKTNSNGFFRTDVYPTKVDRLISHDNPTVFPFICLDMFASKTHDKTLWNHDKSCFLANYTYGFQQMLYLPSSNQTWQWEKSHYVVRWFSIKTSKWYGIFQPSLMTLEALVRLLYQQTTTGRGSQLAQTLTISALVGWQLSLWLSS